MKKTYINKDAALKKLDKAVCFECDKKIESTEEEITNGVLVDYKDLFAYKCDECFKKKPELEGYTKTEVFSRIVGYLRPKDSVNPGKAQEMRERVDYKVPK